MGQIKKKAENEGQEYPSRPLFEQLLAVALFHGEADSHAGDQEQDRDAPDVQQRHDFPQPFQRLLVLDEENFVCPGLKADGNVIDNEQPHGQCSEPVDVIATLPACVAMCLRVGWICFISGIHIRISSVGPDTSLVA